MFLTNDFDDRLEGFNTERYIPCLRTDDLVFKLAQPSVRERLASCSGHDVTDSVSLEQALRDRFQVFKNRGARACAISLPPHFAPRPVSTARADRALGQLATKGLDADASDQEAAGYAVFWKLAELCQEYRLPFDLMIGVNRSVYAAGVYQGQDLYDSRVSLIQYQQLFNAFPEVRFPISVLASVTNQELASYAWIFPNVIANGHWWYSNTPTYIEHDLAARLEAIPRTKQIGYYSDMYKLEFALPKFNMYKRILAKVLAERYVQDRGWSEERARISVCKFSSATPRSSSPSIREPGLPWLSYHGDLWDVVTTEATESTEGFFELLYEERLSNRLHGHRVRVARRDRSNQIEL
ncbi:MAG: glucuronate isomerase [Pirellulaceae bacterium]